MFAPAATGEVMRVLVARLRQAAARLVALLHGGAAGGPVLLAAAIAALVLANSGAGDVYRALLGTPIGVHAGGAAFELSLAGWINDALMAVFFLLIGLEIRHELAEGQLASVSRAAAPAIAALGGMMLPALIYLACASRDPAALRGWAIPVATDIAFSLAALRLLGRRMPVGMAVFLTALAIIDDIGAIAVIAVGYTDSLDLVALAAAALICAGLLVLNRAGVRTLGPYLVGFVLVWAALARSGIHPTLAGVAVAFTVPMRTIEERSPARSLEHELSFWVAWLVLPLFGLANAGLRFSELSLRALLTDPVVAGIVLGLVVGKPLGVAGATWLGIRLGLVRLPAQLTWPLLWGAACLCGIGFTMSLFIGDLAFPSGARAAELRAAILFASVLSAAVGVGFLAWAAPRRVGARPVA
jgi:NhaA family Na+:H+ antiporter